MAANDNSERLSTRPTLDDDAWHIAELIFRDQGPLAYENVQKRVELLEREGNHQVAKLWRDVAEAIKWLQGMPGAGSS